MQSRFIALFVLVGVFAAPALAEAKCFAFRGEDIRVCVDGDDNAARRRAAEICEGVVERACSVSGYSGECRRSSSVRCYDAQGEEQRSIESD